MMRYHGNRKNLVFSAHRRLGRGGTTKKYPLLKLAWWYPRPQVIVVMLGRNMEVRLCYLDCVSFSVCNNLWVRPCMLHSPLLSLAAAWRHTYYGHTLFCLLLFGALYFFSWVMCIEATFQLSGWVQVTHLSSFLPTLVFFYLFFVFFFLSLLYFSPVMANRRQGGEGSQWWKILSLNILLSSGTFFFKNHLITSWGISDLQRQWHRCRSEHFSSPRGCVVRGFFAALWMELGFLVGDIRAAER